MTVEDLARAFVDRTLPLAEWTHHAHLRVGLWHLNHSTEETALNLLRDRIRAYNVATGGANTDQIGYHETITRFYVHLIAGFLNSADRARPIDDLAAEMIDRFGDRHLVLTYWRKETLFSPAARREWVEPDIQSFPAYASRSCDSLVGPDMSRTGAKWSNRTSD